MSDTPFMRLARAETRQKDWSRLRDAIRAHDSEAAEAAWEKCERWIGITDANEVAALTAERDALREALEKCAHPSTWHVPCITCGPTIKEHGNYIARTALKGQTNG